MLASAKANVEFGQVYDSSCIVPLAKELQKMRTLFLLLLLLMTMTKEFVSGFH
jgi:hypothetical protein